MQTSRVLRFTTTRQGSFSGTWEVWNDDLEDELALLRLPNGTVASCSALKEVPDSTVFQTKTLPYADRNIVGEIVSTNAYQEDLCSFGFAYGLKPDLKDCGDACNFLVYTGASCDSPGEHLYNKNKLSATPWMDSRYNTSDSRGVTVFGGCVNTGYESYNYVEKPLIIRGPDNIASSCGIMQPFEPLSYDGTCSLCPFDGFEISFLEASVNLGGPVNVTCEYVQELGESLFALEDCIRAQQAASRSCGCIPQALKATPSTSRQRPAIIALSVVGAIIVAALVLAFLRKRSTQSKDNLRQQPIAANTQTQQQPTENESESQNHAPSHHYVNLFLHMPTAVALPLDHPSEETQQIESFYPHARPTVMHTFRVLLFCNPQARTR